MKEYTGIFSIISEVALAMGLLVTINILFFLLAAAVSMSAGSPITIRKEIALHDDDNKVRDVRQAE